MKENSSRILLGILVIVVGVSLLLEGLGAIPSFGSYIWLFLSKLWPLVFLVFGINFFRSKNSTLGFIFVLLGVSFLANTIFRINFSQVLWPVIIIGIGISLFFKEEKKTVKEKEDQVQEIEKSDRYSKTVIFGEVKKKLESKDYKGGELNVAFSEVILDLRNVQVSKSGSKMHINCAFGEVKIFVPKGCRIKSRGKGVLGEWIVKLAKRNESEPIFEISGTALLSSVELRD